MVAITRLGLHGTSAKPYGTFTHTPPAAGARTYSETFTRHGVHGVSAKPYGSFAGKAVTLTADKYVSMSVKPVVTMGQVTDVDIDTAGYSVVPKLVMVSAAGQQKLCSMTVKPVLTQARSGSVITGTFPKTASMTVKPVLTMSVLREKAFTRPISIVPVLAMSSTVDFDAEELISGAVSVVPVLAMSSTLAFNVDTRTSIASVVPVLTMTVTLAKVNASLSHDVVMVLEPVLTMRSSRKTSGEVDCINITARPCGHIRITKI